MIARGIGPRWLRYALVAVAALYYVFLVKQPPPIAGLHAVTFFSESTCLFPEAASFAIEFRLEVWSCEHRAWEPRDPSEYFPIEANTKESRFQRIGYFYQRNAPVMHALDAWIVDHTPGAGGIRLVKLLHDLPQPGDAVARYAYRPLEPGEPSERKLAYQTPASERKTRCGVR